MNLSKFLKCLDHIVDSEPKELAEDLYVFGATNVKIPSGADPDEFATKLVSDIEDNWGDFDVNFDYGDCNLEYSIEGDSVKIVNNI